MGSDEGIGEIEQAGWEMRTWATGGRIESQMRTRENGSVRKKLSTKTDNVASQRRKRTRSASKGKREQKNCLLLTGPPTSLPPFLFPSFLHHPPGALADAGSTSQRGRSTPLFAPRG